MNQGQDRDNAGGTAFGRMVVAALALGACLGIGVGFLVQDSGNGDADRTSAEIALSAPQVAGSGVGAGRPAPRVLPPRPVAELTAPAAPNFDVLDMNVPAEEAVTLLPEPEQIIQAAIEPEPLRPRIAIVLDDVGLDEKAARRVIALPAEVTLAFLPYAAAAPRLADEARARGHEVLVHVPMEPEGDADPGPNVLSTDLGSDEIAARLAAQLDLFPGAIGFNNHMGSRFTADVRALLPVMREARARGMLFLDSRTTANTLAAKVGDAAGAATLSRDVFLDPAEGADTLLAQLDEVERTALATGSAIAIGHPHGTTLDVLEVWLRGLERKGLVLVTLSDLVDPDRPLRERGLLAASSL